MNTNTNDTEAEDGMTETENKPDLYDAMKSRYSDVIEGSRDRAYRLSTWSDPSMCETECRISSFRDESVHVKVTVVYEDVDGTKSWEEGSECFFFDPDLHDAADVLDQAEAAAESLAKSVTAEAVKSRQRSIDSDISFYTEELNDDPDNFLWSGGGECKYRDRPDLGVTYVARRGADGTVTVTAEPR
jgi:hypothetical protein